VTKSKRKSNDSFQIPKQTKKNKGEKIPIRNDLDNDGIILAFNHFDRIHPFFTLAHKTKSDEPIESQWFLDLFDCFRDISYKNFTEISTCSTYDCHPVNWKNANVDCPRKFQQCDFHQFRLYKSRGRLVGVFNDNIFYLFWLDVHHNLTNSTHYEKARKRPYIKSEYESLREKFESLKAQIDNGNNMEL
jgi:hypothetical protein